MVISRRMVQCLVAMCLFAACTEIDAPVPPAIQESDQPIMLDVEGWKPMTSTRATIFETLNDLQSRDFTMHAYLRNDGYHFIPGSRVHYFVPKGESTGTWRFFDELNYRYFNYYWPQDKSIKIDFFAYTPYNANNISNIKYNSNTKSLTFSCDMNPTVEENSRVIELDDSENQETLFAYTTERGKGNVNEVVELQFVHPFAAVSFKLKQAHRNLTINWIRFNNVYQEGSYTLTENTINSQPLPLRLQTIDSTTINVNKIIPNEINFGGEIGGPYLMLPQAFNNGTSDNTSDDVTITINYTWDNASLDGNDDIVEGDEDYDIDNSSNEKNSNKTYQIVRSITTNTISAWLAGKKYTYILDLGDNQAEILFKVEVEPWEKITYPNVNDIE